jgi:RNA polymerase sigma-70 factor (ECF subfamily)
MKDHPDDFASIYDDYVWDVYGFLGYRVRTREEAEDLTQATFERALRAWGRYDPERASVRTWLLAIARNLLVDHYRRDRSPRHEPLDETEDAERLVGEASVEAEATLGLAPGLEAALAELSARERELIALKFGGDMSGPEIAKVTGLTLANVQQILSRSTRRMRAKLDAADV